MASNGVEGGAEMTATTVRWFLPDGDALFGGDADLRFGAAGPAEGGRDVLILEGEVLM